MVNRAGNASVAAWLLFGIACAPACSSAEPGAPQEASPSEDGGWGPTDARSDREERPERARRWRQRRSKRRRRRSPFETCPARPGAPAGTSPSPDPQQLAYQRLELTAFISPRHGDVRRYGTRGHAAGRPVAVQSDQPRREHRGGLGERAQGAGFRQAMLTAKHSTGFCLWPIEVHRLLRQEQPLDEWPGGCVSRPLRRRHARRGDEGRSLLGPLGPEVPSSSPDYETYYKNQLTELVTNYGPFYELELDGFNAPTSNVNRRSIFQTAKQLTPDMLIWSGPEISNAGGDPGPAVDRNRNGERESIDVEPQHRALRQAEHLVSVRDQRLRSHADMVLASRQRRAHVAGHHAVHLLLVGGEKLDPHLQCSPHQDRRV